MNFCQAKMQAKVTHEYYNSTIAKNCVQNYKGHATIVFNPNKFELQDLH